ncbi:MAG: DNA helicase, partial [Muribaculaceae bacterium]|nr:DNA helicase [Muribaculaceae bacterium]
MKPIEISIDYLKSVNYAMFHNSFPICRHIDITNNTGAELNDVEIRIGGEFILKGDNPTYWGIAAGETFRSAEVRIVPDAARLAALTERVMSSFSVSVIVNEQKLAEEFFEIEFLPFDYWLGTNVMPQTLVSFITPNHPAIANAVVDTAGVMKKLTGSSMLKAYQTGNPNNVRQTVGAVFAALHSRGIIYRSAPASYE